jgi:large subunit ribosomal protein L16
MLMPKKTKHRKMHKAKRGGKASSLLNVDFGSHGLKSLEACWISSRQIEAARRTISRRVKRGGKIFIRVFPDKPITEKPLEVRMGNGKGNVEYWVCEIKPGKILYEMAGVNDELATEAFKLAAAKLPFKTTIVTRTVM